VTQDVNAIVLIGGGVAAASAAHELRAQGYDGELTMLTRELDRPYHRPPITKQLLSNPGHAVDFCDPNWWSEHDVDVRTRSAAATLDPASRSVTLANKQTLTYDQALLATGAMVRRLTIDGAALPGIHYLRTPANARRLREESADAQHVVLVGGSFIAVEVAASLSSQGHRCTLVMQETRCLERTFGPTVGAFVQKLLCDNGVEVLGGRDVVAFTGSSELTGVCTADGTHITADLAVVGAGAVPDTKLAAKAGLDIGPTGGVRCDSGLRTSAPSVYAAGDMCEYDSVVHGRAIRVEHERHAAAQGVTAARNMLGAHRDHLEIPYFWTDIADWARLEYVGPARVWDEEIITGSVADEQFTVWYLDNGRMVAALTCGRSEDLDLARELLAAGGGASHAEARATISNSA
jgi:3-phenylpropionate/trans-cinnamate dioxygenase ferredoxin reductase component